MSDSSDIKQTTGSRARPKTYYSQRMPKGVIETCFRDEVTGTIGKMAEDEFFGLLEPNERVLVWFVDTMGVTGFSPDIGPAGTHFVSRFKKQGGKVMVVAIKLMAVRMMAQAIALASGIKMDIFPTREHALTHLTSVILPRLEDGTL